MLRPMFNIGMGEMILIAVLALIFIGPKQLPEIARSVGRALNELKRATEEISGQITDVSGLFYNTLKDTNREIKRHLSFVEEASSTPPSTVKTAPPLGALPTVAKSKSHSLKEQIKNDLGERV